MDDCPFERFIPIYLLVGGAFGIWQYVSVVVLLLICKVKDSERQLSASSAFCTISVVFTFLFMVHWFAAGELCRDVFCICMQVWKMEIRQEWY